MGMTPIRITITLDGTGVYYDPAEPVMLDGLLAAAVARWHVHGEPPTRDEEPAEIPLPLSRWEAGGIWGWRASAFSPDGEAAQSLVHWRKRMRANRVGVTTGSPNRKMGVYRDWSMPLPLLLVPRLIAWAVGDARRVRRELRKSIRWIGRKRAHGRGRVTRIDVDRCEDDFALVRDGCATRYLPCATGVRLVRPRPPYWSSVGMVPCCEIGSPVRETEAPRTRTDRAATDTRDGSDAR